MERKARTVSWGRRGPFEATPLPSEAGQPEGLYKPFPAAWLTGQTCSRAQLPPAVSSNNKRVLRGTLRALMGLNDPVWLHLGPQPHTMGLGANFRPSQGPSLFQIWVVARPVSGLDSWVPCCSSGSGPVSSSWAPWYWLTPCSAIKGQVLGLASLCPTDVCVVVSRLASLGFSADISLGFFQLSNLCTNYIC